jgi:hypothetical protein
LLGFLNRVNSSKTALPPAPRSVGTSSGFPRFGTYQGALAEVNLSRLSGLYQPSLLDRTLRQKRWQYVLAATPEIIACFAIIDLGYTTSAFVVVTDPVTRKCLVDESFIGLPGQARVNPRPDEGLVAHFRAPGVKLSFTRPEGSDRYDIDVDISRLRSTGLSGLSWKGYLLAAGGPAPLTVIAPVPENKVHVTQKVAGMLAFGELKTHGRKWKLDGGVAGLDYSHGYPPRHTRWHWAMAVGRLDDGQPVGLNLVEGFIDSDEDVNENALWVGDALFPLPRARFTLNPDDPLDAWRVETVGGEVRLKFRPMHVHREMRDYKWIKSRLVQPAGFFEGTLSVPGKNGAAAMNWNVARLAGVTEDQDVLW